MAAGGSGNGDDSGNDDKPDASSVLNTQEADDEGDELTPEEKAEKVHQELANGSDKIIQRWQATADEVTQTAVVDSFVETGVLDHTAAGVDELEAQVVQYAFASHIERNILAPLGLTMETWGEHIAEADAPAFRRAVIEGDWRALTEHAQAAASMRASLGI